MPQRVVAGLLAPFTSPQAVGPPFGTLARLAPALRLPTQQQVLRRVWQQARHTVRREAATWTYLQLASYAAWTLVLASWQHLHALSSFLSSDISRGVSGLPSIYVASRLAPLLEGDASAAKSSHLSGHTCMQESHERQLCKARSHDVQPSCPNAGGITRGKLVLLHVFFLRCLVSPKAMRLHSP